MISNQILQNTIEDVYKRQVFQNYALYPHMTVYDNMSFGLKLRKVPKAEIDKLVHSAAKILLCRPVGGRRGRHRGRGRLCHRHGGLSGDPDRPQPVSYTHLDVYKRQP